MADVFTAAIEDIRDALIAGVDEDIAVADAATDHGVVPHALRNRAIKALGDLSLVASAAADKAGKLRDEQARTEAARAEAKAKAAANDRALGIAMLEWLTANPNAFR